MKYYIANPDLDKQIAEIRRKIRLSMNGIVSDQMFKNGISYKKNYGVDIPRIKEIAKLYIPNNDLAQRLWDLQIRETMIMATLLQPIDKFSETKAQDWVVTFDQIEIVEQTCMNLLCKLPIAPLLCSKWAFAPEVWIQITAYILAARTVSELSQSEVTKLIERGLKISDTTELHLYKAIALYFCRCCRKNKETAIYIQKAIESFLHSSSRSQQYIYTEVQEEILFLNIL